MACNKWFLTLLTKENHKSNYFWQNKIADFKYLAPEENKQRHYYDINYDEIANFAEYKKNYEKFSVEVGDIWFQQMLWSQYLLSLLIVKDEKKLLRSFPKIDIDFEDTCKASGHHLIEVLGLCMSQKIQDYYYQQLKENCFTSKLDNKLITANVQDLGLGADRTILHMAVILNQSDEEINNILKLGCDINSTAYHGCTAFFLALRQRNWRLATLLLKRGANPDIIVDTPEIKPTLLNWALNHHEYEIAQYLVENVSAYNHSIGITNPLHYFIKQNQPGLFQHALTNWKSTIDSVDDQKQNVLHRAYYHQNAKILNIIKDKWQLTDQYKLLLSAVDSTGSTVLHHACTGNKIINIDLLTELIDLGFDLNLQNDSGKTALYYLLQNNKLDASVLQALVLEKNIRLETEFHDKKTPLHLACEQPHANSALIKFLLLIGIDPNLADQEGHTALYYALLHRNTNIIIQLLENKALLVKGRILSYFDRERLISNLKIINDLGPMDEVLASICEKNLTCEFAYKATFFKAAEKPELLPGAVFYQLLNMDSSLLLMEPKSLKM